MGWSSSLQGPCVSNQLSDRDMAQAELDMEAVLVPSVI